MITDKNRFVYIIVIPKQEEKLFARSVFELLYIDKPKIFGNLYKVYSILYFSATGNTKLMAQTLAERLNDEAVDLLSRIKNNDHSEIRSDRPFVICSPVYVSELPSFVSDHLKKLSLVTFKGKTESL